MTTITYQIRPAVIQDYRSLCDLMKVVDQLHSDHFPDRYKVPEDQEVRSIEYIRETIEDSYSSLFVALKDEILLGFILVTLQVTSDFPIMVKRKFAVIENIGVHPDHRQQGLATALMKSAEEWAKEKGAHNMELNVYLFNSNAQLLYNKLGYSPISQKMSKTLE